METRARKSTGGVLVRRRKRGTYYAVRFRALGKRQYLTLGSADEGWSRRRAEEELENVLADVRRGLWRPTEREPEPEAPSPEPTFHHFASEWMEVRRHELRPSTVNDYTWQLSNHLLPFFAGHSLGGITAAEVDRYRSAKVAEGQLSANSINKTITRLAQILELAVEYGHLEKNPARGRRRKLKETPPVRTWLDRADQIESLLDAAGECDAVGRGPRLRRALLATLTFAGLRLGEALGLRWRDLDLAAGRLRVTDAKTSTGIRNVDLLPVLRDELAAYKAEVCEAHADGLVFATGTGKPQSQSNVRDRVLAKAVAAANQSRAQRGLGELPEGLTPRSLRRTFISLLLAIGDEVPYVMQQVGHAGPTVTLSIYAQVMFRKDGERERLRSLLGAVESPGRLGLSPERQAQRAV